MNSCWCYTSLQQTSCTNLQSLLSASSRSAAVNEVGGIFSDKCSAEQQLALSVFWAEHSSVFINREIIQLSKLCTTALRTIRTTADHHWSTRISAYYENSYSATYAQTSVKVNWETTAEQIWLYHYKLQNPMDGWITYNICRFGCTHIIQPCLNNIILIKLVVGFKGNTWTKHVPEWVEEKQKCRDSTEKMFGKQYTCLWVVIVCKCHIFMNVCLFVYTCASLCIHTVCLRRKSSLTT